METAETFVSGKRVCNLTKSVWFSIQDFRSIGFKGCLVFCHYVTLPWDFSCLVEPFLPFEDAFNCVIYLNPFDGKISLKLNEYAISLSSRDFIRLEVSLVGSRT